MQVAVVVLAAVALLIALIDSVVHRVVSPLHVATILLGAALLVLAVPLR